MTQTKIPVNAMLDATVNNEIRFEIKLKKKIDPSTESAIDRFGIMIEKQHKLEKLLEKKKLTFEELLTNLKKTNATT